MRWTSEEPSGSAQSLLLVVLAGLVCLQSNHRPATLERHRRVPKPSAMCIEELQRHIARLGSQSALARALGVSGVLVNHWVNGRQRVPECRVEVIRTAKPIGGDRTSEADTNLSGMSADQIKELVKLAGGTRKLARLFACAPSTAANYASGKRRVPPWVLERLESLARVQGWTLSTETAPKA
ncbi:MAG TPA: YdaS family helix-turn-helix protein [Polyangiaceae bacterium]|nr:YdaS family helix-turn-helix protein [Polyangiaceae bacterium]